MIYYDSFEEKFTDREMGEYVSYGIEVFRITDEARETICKVHDVFLSESKAKEFAELCNSLNLSPIHIYDVIQDAIG